MAHTIAIFYFTAAQAGQVPRSTESILAEAEAALSRADLPEADIPKYKLIQMAGRMRSKLLQSQDLLSEPHTQGAIALCNGLGRDNLPPTVTKLEYATLIQPIIAANLTVEAHALTKRPYAQLNRSNQDAIDAYLQCLMSPEQFWESLRDIRDLRIAVRNSSAIHSAWDIVYSDYTDPSAVLEKATRLDELVRTIYFSGVAPVGDGLRNFEYQIAKFAIAEAQAALGNFAEAEHALSALNIDKETEGLRKTAISDKIRTAMNRLQLLADVQDAQGKFAEAERAKSQLAELGKMLATNGYSDKLDIWVFTHLQAARARAYARSGDFAGADLILTGLLAEKQITRILEAHIRLIRAELLRATGRHDEATEDLLFVGRFVELGKRTPFHKYVEYLGDGLLRKGDPAAMRVFLDETRRTIVNFHPNAPFEFQAKCQVDMELNLFEAKWLRTLRKFNEAQQKISQTELARACWAKHAGRGESD